MTAMLDSVSHAREQAGGLLHSIAARPSDSRSASNLAQSDSVECGICHELRTPDAWCLDMEVGEYAVCAECNRPQPAPRRMVAVTVALSEPVDGSPLDWSETVASLLRLAFANTSVHVIDTWRNDVPDSRS